MAPALDHILLFQAAFQAINIEMALCGEYLKMQYFVAKLMS
jgi:hypothetical protein